MITEIINQAFSEYIKNIDRYKVWTNTDSDFYMEIGDLHFTVQNNYQINQGAYPITLHICTNDSCICFSPFSADKGRAIITKSDAQKAFNAAKAQILRMADISVLVAKLKKQ